MLYRSQVLAEFRASNPNAANWTDDDILSAYKERGVDVFDDVAFMAPSPAPEPPPAPPEEAGFFRTAGDAGAAVMGGFASVGKSVGDLYGLATGDTDNFVSNLGQESVDYWNSLKSDAFKQAAAERSQAVAAQEGELAKAWTAIKETATSPRLLVDFVAEQLPMLLPSVGAAKGVVAARYGARLASAEAALASATTAAEKAAAAQTLLSLQKAAAAAGTAAGVGAGRVMQGTDIGAGQFDELTAQLGSMTDEQALQLPEIASLVNAGSDIDSAKAALALSQARKAGVLGGLISVASMKMPGGSAVEKALARYASGVPVSGGIVKSLVGEATQEAIEEGGGRLAQNITARAVEPGRALSQGVGEAAGMGALGGGLIGGGIAGLESLAERVGRPAPEQQAPAQVVRTPLQRAPLVPTVPELSVPENVGEEAPAEQVEVPAGEAATTTTTAAPALASEEQQQILVNVLGLSEEQAMTISAAEADALIEQFQSETEQANIEAAARRQADELARRRQASAGLLAGFEADARTLPPEDYTGAASVRQAEAMQRAQQAAARLREKSFGPTELGGQGYFPEMLPTAAQRRKDLATGAAAPAAEKPLPPPTGQLPLFTNVRGAKKAASVIAPEAPKTVGLAEVKGPQAAPELASQKAIGAPAPAKIAAPVTPSAPVETAPPPSPVVVDNQPTEQPAPSGADTEPTLPTLPDARAVFRTKNLDEAKKRFGSPTKANRKTTKFVAILPTGEAKPIRLVAGKYYAGGSAISTKTEALNLAAVQLGLMKTNPQTGKQTPNGGLVQTRANDTTRGEDHTTALKALNKHLGTPIDQLPSIEIVELTQPVETSFKVEGTIPDAEAERTVSARSQSEKFSDKALLPIAEELFKTPTFDYQGAIDLVERALSSSEDPEIQDLRERMSRSKVILEGESEKEIAPSSPKVLLAYQLIQAANPLLEGMKSLRAQTPAPEVNDVQSALEDVLKKYKATLNPKFDLEWLTSALNDEAKRGELDAVLKAPFAVDNRGITAINRYFQQITKSFITPRQGETKKDREGTIALTLKSLWDSAKKKASQGQSEYAGIRKLNDLPDFVTDEIINRAFRDRFNRGARGVSKTTNQVFEETYDRIARNGLTKEEFSKLFGFSLEEAPLADFNAKLTGFLQDAESIWKEARDEPTLTGEQKEKDAIESGLNVSKSKGDEDVRRQEAGPSLIDTYVFDRPDYVVNTARMLAARGATTVFSPDLGSTFNRKTQIITVAGENLTAPTRVSANALFHEAVHHISENASPEIHAAAHRAVQDLILDDSRVLNANASPEEKLAQSLADRGMDRELSTSLSAEIMRLVKDWLLRGAMWVQNQLFGKTYESTALAWVENHVDRFMAGDTLTSFLDTLPVVSNEAGQVILARKDGIQIANFSSDGTILFRPATPDSIEAIEHNIRMPLAIAKAKAAPMFEALPDVLAQDIAIQRSKAKIQEVRDEQGRLMAPNGKPSKLDTNAWKMVRTPEFKAWFGDWEGDPANASKVVDPETGEPMVVYHGTGNNFDVFDRTANEENLYGASANDILSTMGNHFAVDVVVANNFAKGVYGDSDKKAPNVMPVFLNIRNLASVGEEMEFKDTLYRGNVNSYTVEQILENESAPEDALVAMPGEETQTADERFARYDSDPDFRATINRQAESEEARLDEPWFDTREALVEEWRRTNPEVDGILYENQASKETRGAKNKNAFIAFRSEQIKSLYNEGTFAADNPDIRKQEVAEPRQLLSDVLRSTLASTKRTVAALNEIDAFQKEMAREVAKVGVTDPVKELGFHDVAELKAKAIAALNKALSAEISEPEGPLFPDDIRIDTAEFTDAERAEAEETFRKMASSLKQKAGSRFEAARDFLSKNTVGGAVEVRRKRIDEIISTLTQAKDQHRLALREIVDQAQRLIHKGIPGEVEAAEKASASRAVLEQLDKDAARLFSTDRAQKLIDSLPVNELSLESIFKAIFDLEARNDVSLADTPVSVIRNLVLQEAESNADLQPLVSIGEGPDAKVRGTALLSALLGFIKQDAILADVIRLRITQGSRAHTQQLKIAAAYRDENDTRLREISANAKGAMKVPGNRAIAKLIDELDSLRAIERNRKRFERVDKSASFVKPLLDEAIARVEARQQVGYDAHMQYFTFDEAGSLVARPITDLYDGAQPNAAKVRAARKALESWIETQKPEGREYFTALDMVSELKRHEIEQVQEVRTSIYSRLAEDLVRQLRGIGLPEADAVANMVTRNENIKRGYLTQVRALGAPVDAAKVRLAEALGGAKAYPTVDAAFVRAKSLMQQPELDQKDGLAVVRRDFERDIRFVEMASSPRLWSLFETWIKASDKANVAVEEILRRYGTRVADSVSDENPLDAGVEEPLLRGYIPRAGYSGGTYATTYSQQAREVANYLAGNGRLEELKNFRQIIDQDPATALEGIEKFFSDNYLLNHFVMPLVNNPRPSIPAPIGPDGIRMAVDPSNVRVAWDKAGNSIVKFADELLIQAGYKTDRELEFNYRKQLIQFFANRANRLATDAGTKSEGQMIASGVVDGFAVDARINHNEPPEWRSSVQMGTQDLRNIIHSVAAQEAYGREGRRLNKLVSSLNTKLHEAKRIVTENGPEFQALSPEDKKKYVLWTELYETRWGNTDVIKAIVKETNPENSSVGHLPFVQDMFGAAVSAMLANVRSAVTDLSSFMRPFFFERSLEMETIGRVGAQAKNYLRGGLFSTFEGITGMKVQKDAIDQLIEQSMGGSSANSYRMIDALTGKVSPGADNRLISKPTDRFMHKASLVAHRRVFLPIKETLIYGGLGKNTGSNVRMRVNPFAWSSEVQSVGSLRTYLEAVQRYVQVGAEWLKQNPDSSVLESPLGKKSAAFQNIYTALSNAGLNLQTLSEKVAKAPGKTAFDFMTAEDVHAVNGVIQDNIILESGPATRPRAVRESSVGRLAGTLVGWSLGASVQSFDLLRTPEGRINYASILRGAGIAMAALLPLSVAFSYMLDFYDDELLGKKRDQRRLQGDPEEMARAVLDRSVALGTFGIAGEVANYVTNNDEGAGRKILSVDQRVVPISMTLAMLKAVGNISSVGLLNTTYVENWRPLVVAMGGNGLYQNIQLLNNLMGDPFEDEAGINQRINAQNYLRIGAREIGIPRQKRGGMEFTMDPVTPAIGEMYRAAMRDDPEAFRLAYKRAVKMAEKLPNQPDPLKVVRDRFSDRNILRSTVGTLGTDDVRMILDRLPPEGRQAVIDQVSLHNRYGAALGIKPYAGSERNSNTLMLRRAQRATGAEAPTLEAIRQAAARMRDTGSL